MEPFFTTRPHGNGLGLPICRAILWEIGLLVVILYVPFLQRVFEVSPLTAWEWLFLLAWSHTILPVLEFGKWLERTGVFERKNNIDPVPSKP